jgi:CYTH domain-containing protein
MFTHVSGMNKTNSTILSFTFITGGFMEIEKKYTIKKLPSDLEAHGFRIIEQGYLCTDPVMRIRRDNDDYYFTYKGKGLLAREEYNLPITKESYEHLLPKIDGRLIQKKRYMIPIPNPVYRQDYIPNSETDFNLTIELDLFSSPTDLIMAEVEFPSVEAANAFIAPDWFETEVTDNPKYHNSNMIFI